MLGMYRKRIEGDAAYPPEGMRDLAKGYRKDALIWHDDPEEAERKAAKNDEWLQWYEAGYWARQHADQVETEVNTDEVNGWFELGRDIYRLREHLDEVVDHVRQVADSEVSGWDADAVIESVADKWSVSRGAVHLLIESLTVEDSTIQEALTFGGKRLRESEDLALAPGGPTEEPKELPENDDHDRADEGDADRSDQAADVVEAEMVEEQPEAVRDGGRDRSRESLHDPADLASDEVIDLAEQLLRDGEEQHVVELELRDEASGENEIKAAIAAARDRIADSAEPPDDRPAVADGGELADG
jgi:hypothetical protein